jgi:hypothetical protein
MHCVGCVSQRSWPSLRHYSDICLARLRNITESLRIVGISAEMRIGHLLIESLEPYH